MLGLSFVYSCIFSLNPELDFHASSFLILHETHLNESISIFVCWSYFLFLLSKEGTFKSVFFNHWITWFDYVQKLISSVVFIIRLFQLRFLACFFLASYVRRIYTSLMLRVSFCWYLLSFWFDCWILLDWTSFIF